MIEFDQVSYTAGKGNRDWRGSVSQGKARLLLKQLNFRIPAGQWVSIIGRNGSGKSTLVKLMNRLIPSTEGRIMILGEELTAASVGSIREQVGMVFPNPDNQFVGFTVTDDIVFGLENRCLDRVTMQARLTQYATKLNITPLLNRHPSELSGGQKQRVALAAVLALEPKIVIFDEATSMLDEQSKHDTIALMQEMKRSEQYTIISVTHDHDEIAASDRVLALAEGVIAGDCSAEELWTRTELLEACGLTPSFYAQLRIELLNRGIELGAHLHEKEAVNALWEFNLNKSATRTVTKQA